MPPFIPSLHRVPGAFALAVTEQALGPEGVDAVMERLAQAPDWKRHDQYFYQCFIQDVHNWPASHGDALRSAVADALEMHLAGPIGVTLQRMDPGDGAAPHTDSPRAGFEVARLVVQLDTVAGGCFRALDDGVAWFEQAPSPNLGVAFELCDHSWHEVTPSEGVRRTIVFHFWHPANPPLARPLLDATVGTMRFTDLPTALDASIARADQIDPEHTHRAAQIAWWLQRWGYADPILVSAFDRSVQQQAPHTSDEALARFLGHLHREGFDRRAWQTLPASATRRWTEMLASA